jgi:hypothetical protein
MAFYRDAPNVLQEVTWYFADPRADQIRFAHPFYSRIYDINEFPEDILGERYEPRGYMKGKPPYPVSFGGLCGSREQWQHGASAMDPLPARYPGTDVPVCCSPPPDLSAGEVIGFPTDDRPKIHPCAFFDFVGTPPVAFTTTFSMPWFMFPTVNVGDWVVSIGGWLWQQTPVAFHALQLVYTCSGSDFIVEGLIPIVFGFPFQPPALFNAPPDEIDTVEPSMTWYIDYPGFIDVPAWKGTMKMTWSY